MTSTRSLRKDSWTVKEVGAWLESIGLGIYANEFGEFSFELRAKDRDDAKAQVKRKYLEATFWN